MVFLPIPLLRTEATYLVTFYREEYDLPLIFLGFPRARANRSIIM